MTDSLSNWIELNKMEVSESKIDDSDIISIKDFGTFLYLHSFDGKVIDEDFAFMLSDEEFDILEENRVDFVLFEFGSKFYYSGIKKDKNTKAEPASGSSIISPIGIKNNAKAITLYFTGLRENSWSPRKREKAIAVANFANSAG